MRREPPSRRSTAWRNSFDFPATQGILPSGPARTLGFVIRLRALTEAECWARCYGSWDSTVTIVHREPRRPRFPTTVSGEDLRRSLEERLDARLAAEAEAA